jgi:hypothetical protein
VGAVLVFRDWRRRQRAIARLLADRSPIHSRSPWEN